MDAIQAIDITVPIIVGLICYFAIKKAFESEAELKLNGVAWGLISGIFGGLVITMLVYAALRNKIQPIKSKKYQKYAQQELKRFIISFFATWVAALLLFLIFP